MQKIFLIFIVIIFPVYLVAQKTKTQTRKEKEKQEKVLPSFTFSINAGDYIPSNYTANFYNGNPNNLNSINYILGNYYYSQDIQRALNDTFSLYGLPMNMGYSQPAMMAGILFETNFSRTMSAFIQFNYTKLTSKDVVLLKVGATPISYTNPTLIQCPIWGKETRMNIDIGVRKIIPIKEKIDYFIGGGVNFNNTIVGENKIIIGSTEYSLINIYGNQQYVPNQNLQVYTIREGGIGVGFFAETGVKFKFGDYISIDPGVDFYFTKIKFDGYDAYKPQLFVFLRFSFNKFVSFGPSNNE